MRQILISSYVTKALLAKAGRETIGEEVHLLRDGRIVSRWLVGTTEPIPVDERVREDLRYDFNTPQKLKEATDFQISFAINVDESGAFEKVNNSVVYTFLPTSYGNLGLPFWLMLISSLTYTGNSYIKAPNGIGLSLRRSRNTF